MSKSAVSTGNLPKPIAEKLDRAARRIRLIIALRGLCAVLAVAFASFLVVMAVDAVAIIFSSFVRWTLSLAAFTAVIVAAYRFLVRPLLRRLTPAEIARVIETRNEAYKDERISSSVEILNSQYIREGNYSESLINQLVSQAEEDAGTVIPQQIFTWRSARRFIIALALAALVYATLFLAWPQHSARLFMRAIAPYARIGSLYSEQLTITPGDVRLAAGDSLTIKAELQEPFTRRVELRVVGEDGKETVERMRPDDPHSPDNTLFTASFPVVRNNFEYRVRAGRTLTEFYRARVFERPEITQIHLREEFAPYTGREPRTESKAPGRIRARLGSTLKLAVETSVPLEDAELLIDEEPIGRGNRATFDGKPVMEWTFPVGAPSRTVHWHVDMESNEGFTNEPVRRRELVIEPDEPPAVTVTRPQSREVRMAPDGFLRLEYEASDDVAIDQVQLRVSAADESTLEIEQTTPEPQDGVWRGRIPVDLGHMDIGRARMIQLEVVVYDNLPQELGGPNRAVSETITILIEDDAEPLVFQDWEPFQETGEQMFDEAIRDLEEIKQKTEEMFDWMDIDEEQAFDQAGEIRDDLAAVEERLEDLADFFEDSLYESIAEALREMIEDHIAGAQELSEELPMTDDEEERMEMAEEMDQQVEDALEQAQDIRDQMDSISEAVQDWLERMDMAHRQEQLAHQAQLPDWPDMEDDWRQRQQEMAFEIGLMSQEMQEQTHLASQMEQTAHAMEEAAQAARDAADTAQQEPTVEQAQEAALAAQEQAAQAQQEAQEAQREAESARTEEEQQVALEAAAEAQQEAAEAQQRAQQAQQAAAEALEEAGAETAAEAQRAAERAQEEAASDQQHAQEAHQQAREEGAEEARQDAHDAQQEAIQRQQEAYEAQLEAQAEFESARDAMQEARLPAAEEAAQLVQEAAESVRETAETARDEGMQQMSQRLEEIGDETRQVGEDIDDAGRRADETTAPSLDESAERMTQLAESMREMVPTQAEMERSEMAEAAHEAAESAADAETQEQAASDAAEAADQLEQMADSMAMEMGRPQIPFPFMGRMPDERGRFQRPPPPESDQVPEWAADLGLTRGDWARLRGMIEADAEAVDDIDVPGEYRELIRRYFRRISRDD